MNQTIPKSLMGTFSFIKLILDDWFDGTWTLRRVEYSIWVKEEGKVGLGSSGYYQGFDKWYVCNTKGKPIGKRTRTYVVRRDRNYQLEVDEIITSPSEYPPASLNVEDEANDPIFYTYEGEKQ